MQVGTIHELNMPLYPTLCRRRGGDEVICRKTLHLVLLRAPLPVSVIKDVEKTAS